MQKVIGGAMSIINYLDYDGLEEVANIINKHDGKRIKGTLLAGQSQLVFNDSWIKDSAVIDIYPEFYDINPFNIIQEGSTLTLTFLEQLFDLDVIIVIRDLTRIEGGDGDMYKDDYDPNEEVFDAGGIPEYVQDVMDTHETSYDPDSAVKNAGGIADYVHDDLITEAQWTQINSILS